MDIVTIDKETGLPVMDNSFARVVRCKDCKHNSLNRVTGNTYCDLGIELYQLYDY